MLQSSRHRWARCSARFSRAGKLGVDDGLVGQRPQPFGGLELGGVGRQEEEDDTLGRFDLLGDVPAGVVEHQDDDLVGAGAGLAGEGLEGFLEGLDVDGVEEIPDHLARVGLDEAVELKPLIAVVDLRRRPAPA